MYQAWWWLSFNLLSIGALAFYSMVEMACVSINKARLHFYAMEGSRPAKLLQQLLRHPSRLFGTTLIGVNLATVIGSECAREFHASIGVDPDLAPISQVILVVIFGELAPMFAARNYAEHVALLGSSLLYLSSLVLSPFLWSLEYLTNFIDRLMGGEHTPAERFLSKEELQKMLEIQESASEAVVNTELTTVSASLFKMHTQTVQAVIEPLDSLQLLPSDANITQLRSLWRKAPSNFIALYQRKPSDIVGIIYPRDVLRSSDNQRVSECARSPWFVTATTSLSHMIKQFCRNNQNLAIVIDASGCAIGVATFSAIINEVFGQTHSPSNDGKEYVALLWEKTLPGNMTVKSFEQQFGTRLDENEELTLGDLVIHHLDHHPNVGDKVMVGSYEITVKATFLLDIKTVSVTGARSE